jgi:hypothetical protein
MKASDDRGEIMHFAGFHGLSPALDTGSGPAFSAEAGDGLTRCGWESFFRVLGSRGLALAYDPADAASAKFVPAAGARPEGGGNATLSGALEHSRRFWRAVRAGRGETKPEA